MTGGVDLTGVADLTGNGDTLDRLNKQPEVINTLTGGHDQGMIPNVNMPADPVTENAPPGKDVTRGLEEVARAYDGVPVRVRPASRFRTMQYQLAAGQVALIAQSDSRRTSMSVSIIPADLSTTVCLAYVGADRSTLDTMGMFLATGTPGPAGAVFTHGDSMYIQADANNAVDIVVGIGYEVQE